MANHDQLPADASELGWTGVNAGGDGDSASQADGAHLRGHGDFRRRQRTIGIILQGARATVYYDRYFVASFAQDVQYYAAGPQGLERPAG